MGYLKNPVKLTQLPPYLSDSTATLVEVEQQITLHQFAISGAQARRDKKAVLHF